MKAQSTPNVVSSQVISKPIPGSIALANYHIKRKSNE